MTRRESGHKRRYYRKHKHKILRSRTAWYQKNKQRLIELQRKRRAVRQDLINRLKSGPCADCGSSYPSVCMQFDHVPERGKKLFHISSKIANWGALMAEVAKCDVVCANCHALRTMARKSGIGV